MMCFFFFLLIRAFVVRTMGSAVPMWLCIYIPDTSINEEKNSERKKGRGEKMN